MNFDPSFENINFDPMLSSFISQEAVTSCPAESSIVKTIVEGSGGPDNEEITESGLRFVRHLLSNSRAIRLGFMPNFKSMEVIQEMAREFIRRCGDTTIALQTMHAVTNCE